MILENEDKIIELASSGSSDAIEKLIKHYQPDLKKFASGVCQTTEDAEDAVQHSLIVISSKISSFKKLSKLSSWLFTIIKNECIKFTKQRSRNLELNSSLEIENISTYEKISKEEALKHIKNAINNLEPIYREVFLLRDIEGLSGYEVSQRLGISLASMKSRLYRARQEIKKSLKNIYSCLE
jgi:RNA polymerase sigma factor (sigma-70 family)